VSGVFQMSKISHADVYMPYYKQGDDLHSCLEQTNGDPIKAFRLHAEYMHSAAKLSEDIADFLEKYQNSDACVAVANALQEKNLIEVSADTHHISISADSDLILQLVERFKDAGVSLYEDEFEDEVFEEEEE